MRCSLCSSQCGDDHNTRTRYEEERNLGDRMKVVLLQVYDMMEVDNLQKAEIISLLVSLVDEHIVEYETLKKKPETPPRGDLRAVKIARYETLAERAISLMRIVKALQGRAPAKKARSRRKKPSHKQQSRKEKTKGRTK